jgi:putative GTP pyrophosphokinase
VGFVTTHQPKFNRGDDAHIQFFRLASEIIARAYENNYSCFADLSDQQLVAMFTALDRQINLMSTLRNLHRVDKEVANKKVCILMFSERGLDVRVYSDMSEATRALFQLEQEDPIPDIVLVRANTWQEIRSAYRNYFSDAHDFVGLIDAGLDALGRTERGHAAEIQSA